MRSAGRNVADRPTSRDVDVAVGRRVVRYGATAPAWRPDTTRSALERGEADLAVVGDFGDGELASAPWLETVPLVTDELLAVLPGATGPVALSALADDPWVLDGTELEHWLVRACRRTSFEPRVAGRLFAHESLLHAVRTGLGVTVLPAMALLDATGVATVSLDPPVSRELSVLHRRDAVQRRSVAVTLDPLVAAAELAEQRSDAPGGDAATTDGP